MAGRTDCRMNEVLRRAKKRKHSQENHLIAGLSSTCVALFSGLLGSIGSVSGAVSYNDIVNGAYGTVMLHSGAGAYVLVGLLAFVTGVVITALCIRIKLKNKRFAEENNNKDDF